MDFALTDEQDLLRRTLREFLESYCTKQWIDDVEARAAYPTDLFERFAELGLFGLGIPEDQGGHGGGMIETAIVSEELGRISGSVVQTYQPTGLFGVHALLAAGPELRAEFLPRVAAGELQMSFALTEPDAGSDAAALRTRAVRDGDDYVISGSKIFATGADSADVIVIAARTGAVGDRRRGVTAFLVDADSPGITATAIHKLGHHAVHACEIGLADVRVPAGRMIGEEGAAWTALTDVLDAERIGVAGLCTGVAQRCTDMALDYGMQRRQFGQPIATFQAISHMLADMETEASAARMLTYHAAWLKDQGRPCSKAASIAKAYATECATRNATRGMQVLGGYCYTTEYEMERFYREAKLYEVAGGATQIQRNIIAREMGIRARPAPTTHEKGFTQA